VPKSAEGIVFPYKGEDLRYFRMRDMDYRETSVSTGHMFPLQILNKSIKQSEHVWILRPKDTIEAVFGIKDHPNNPYTGIPWLIGSKDISLSPIQFIRIARDFIDVFSSKHRWLVNLILAEYTTAIRMVELLGFTVYKIHPVQISDEQYYFFTKYNEEVTYV